MINKSDERSIEYDYVHAKAPEAQIKILAECYGVPTIDIRKLLAARGVYKVTGAVMEKLKQELCNGKKLSNVRNYVAAVKDCKSEEIKLLLKDWNKTPWDTIPETVEETKEPEEEPKKQEEEPKTEVKKVETPAILIEFAMARIRDLDVKLENLMNVLRDTQQNIGQIEAEKANIKTWLEATT